MDADAMDRHIPSSSPEAIYRTYPVIDPLTSTSHKFTDSTVIDAYASSLDSRDSPSAMILHSSFSAQLPKLHSSVKKNINTRSSKY